MSHVCKYCKKSFTKESTLTTHSCERRRRFQQEREIGVQWGLRAYRIFYSTTQSGPNKTYEDFVNSNYYTAFVKFGRHCHNVHCINIDNFTNWLLKNNRRLDQWCSESNYSAWLVDYLCKENVKDALERSIQTMIDFTNEHPEYRNNYRDYFRLVPENRICYHITTGRISAWAVYQSRSGQDFLSRLNSHQVAMITAYIDPDFWSKKFRDCPDDVTFVKQVLVTAGL